MRTSLRKVGTVVGALGAAAAVTVAGVGVASADPASPSAVTIAGVGSDTSQFVVNAIANSYDKLSRSTHPGYIGSWNATGSSPVNVKPSKGATCNLAVRPFGSSAGISALLASIANHDGCIDFARSSRGKKTDGTENSLSFYQFARDGESWATFPSAVTPASLTGAQLQGIYNCTITNWSQVGGQNKPIKPYLPQSTSGTRAFWLSAIGLTAPGPCVNTLGDTLNENDAKAIAADAGAEKNQAIIGFSIGQFLSDSRGLSPDLRAGFVLKKIEGKSPTVRTKKQLVLNAGFAPSFLRLLYNVTSATAPASVTNLFGPGGYVCSQRATILKWGFGAINNCGVKS